MLHETEEVSLDDIKRIGEGIAATERRLRAYGDVIDAVSDAIIAIDFRGLVTVWNPAAEKLFGWSAAETLGNPLTRFVMESKYWDAHTQAVGKVVQSGEISPSKQSVVARRMGRRKDGTEVPVDLRLSTYENGDNRTRIVAVIREVLDG